MDRLSFSSDHVNYLILRYLQESRFSHSAYTFAHECNLSRDALEPGEVPPGALVHIIQKGLQCIELEANVTKDGANSSGEYTFLNSKDLITKDVDELRRDVQNKRQRSESHGNDGSGCADGKHCPPRDEVKSEVPEEEDVAPEKVTTLRGHTTEVFVCAWNPTEDLLASGSGDTTARIWSLNRDARQVPTPVVLEHLADEGEATGKGKDVITLNWSPDGELLATGLYNGLARIWTKTGAPFASLHGHDSPIFSLKWNRMGTSLVSCSVDKTAIVWDVKAGAIQQVFQCHSGAVLDVDWKNDTTFASCSTDNSIYVCEVGADQPVMAFQGHQSDVNSIKWDPRGQLLASCSIDTTARIWSLNRDKPLIVLRGHTKEIYTVKWSPGSESEGANRPPLLASASFDTTVKLWDLESGTCKHNLAKHSMAVYSIAFSPNGQFLASGSFDKKLLIWNVADGRLVKSFTGRCGIYEVDWNRDGTQVAACGNNKVVSVLDMRI